MSAAILPSEAYLPRSFGVLDLHFAAAAGVTRVLRAYQQGVMRVRFPNVAAGLPPEAVLVNTAGGLTGGDKIETDVKLAAGGRAVVTTQAHEKIYRSARGDALVAARLDAGAGATLQWLPQPTILFDGARLARETHVVMAADATFLGVEAVIFGRTAMDEAMRGGHVNDHWTIRRGGRLIHADRFAAEGNVADLLARPSVLAGRAAMATIRYVAADAEKRLDDMRAVLGDDGAASAWNGMLLARLTAQDGYRLGHALTRVLTGFRGRALPPAWSL